MQRGKAKGVGKQDAAPSFERTRGARQPAAVVNAGAKAVKRRAKPKASGIKTSLRILARRLVERIQLILSRLVDRTEAKPSGEIGLLKARVEGLEKEKQEASEKLQAASKQIGELSEQKQQLDATLAKANERIQELAKEKQELEARAKKAEERRREPKKAEETPAMQKRREALEKKLAEAQTKAQSLAKQKQETETQLQQAKKRAEELSKQKQELEKRVRELEALSTENERLEKELAQIKAKMEELAKQKQELEARAKKAEEKKEEPAGSAERKAKGKPDAQAIAGMREELEQLAKEKTALEQKLAKVEAAKKNRDKSNKRDGEELAENLRYFIKKCEEKRVSEELSGKVKELLEHLEGYLRDGHYHMVEYNREEWRPVYVEVINALDAIEKMERKIEYVAYEVERERKKGMDVSIANDYLSVAKRAFEARKLGAADRHLEKIECELLPPIRLRGEEERVVAGVLASLGYEGARRASEQNPVDFEAAKAKLGRGETPIIDFGNGRVIVLRQRVGGGGMTDVFEGWLIDLTKTPRECRRVAVKVYHEYLGSKEAGLVTDRKLSDLEKLIETFALKKINKALEREPAENFPGGVKRSYYPVLHSDVDTASSIGVCVVSFCDGMPIDDYARHASQMDCFGLSLQYLHALAVAESEGILLPDLKCTILSGGGLIVNDGTVKLIDWNVVTLITKGKEGDLRHQLGVSKSLNYWLGVTEAMLRLEGPPLEQGKEYVYWLKDVGGFSEVYDFIEKINDAEKFPPWFALLVQKAVVEQGFGSIREAYDYALKAYKGEIAAEEVERGAAQLRAGVEKFNAEVEQRRAQWKEKQRELERLVKERE